jgi:antitoxin component YwqK of YwqJK toxin-antitoxin module
MKQFLFLILFTAAYNGYSQLYSPKGDSTISQVFIPFEFTSEEDNKLAGEDDSVKYYVASDGKNLVSINEESSYYKLLTKEHKVITDGPFIAEGDKFLQDGKWTERFDNGKIKMSGYYHRNNPIGTWREFYSNGKPKAIYNYAIIMDNGETYTCLSGSYQEFYQTGKLKVNGFYSANAIKVKDTIYVQDPVTLSTVSKVLTHNIYYPEKTGHWEYYTESGELDKKDDN